MGQGYSESVLDGETPIFSHRALPTCKLGMFTIDFQGTWRHDVTKDSCHLSKKE